MLPNGDSSGVYVLFALKGFLAYKWSNSVGAKQPNPSLWKQTPVQWTISTEKKLQDAGKAERKRCFSLPLSDTMSLSLLTHSLTLSPCCTKNGLKPQQNPSLILGGGFSFPCF